MRAKFLASEPKSKPENENKNFLQYKLHYYLLMIRAMRIAVSFICLVSIVIALSTDQKNVISFTVGAGLMLLFNFVSSTLIIQREAKYSTAIAYIVILMTATLVFSLEMMYESLQHDSKIAMLSYGIMIGLLFSFILLSRTPWYYCLICFLNAYIYWEIRLADFETDLQNRIASSGTLILIMVFVIFVFYKQDNLELDEYTELKKNERGLLHFRKLIKEVIPNQILIIKVENEKEPTVLFANEAAKGLFQTEENTDILTRLERISFLYTETEEELASPHEKNFQSFKEFLYLNKGALRLNKFKKYQGDYMIDKKCAAEAKIIDIDNLGRLVKIRLEISCGLIEWDNNEIAVAIILNDISKTKKIHELEVLHRKKDDLLATVSHSLRTPLNGITGMVAVTRDRINTKADKKNLTIAMSAANTLKLFINDLLDMSKMSRKRLTLNLKMHNLWEVVLEVVGLIKYQTKQKGLQFKFFYDFEKSLEIYLDKSRLQQILLNLISNAVKFTSKGTIELKIYRMMNRPINNEDYELTSPSPISHDSDIYFSVSDTGCGIKEEKFPNFFKMFNNNEKNDSANLTGVGLGLSISNKLVKILNPKNREGIKFHSEYGVGSRFWFFLEAPELRYLQPKSNKYEEGERDPLLVRNFQKTYLNKLEARTFMGLQKVEISIKRVLLVDDDPVNLLVLCKFMEAMNIREYVTAENGKLAIEKVREALTKDQFFDFILMDCNMPIMDGYEASKLIKKMVDENFIKPLKIFAVTANVTEMDKKKCFNNGMDHVFTKPLIKGEFMSELKSLISLKEN